MNRKLYLLIALIVALVLSGGVYAYTYTTALGTVNVAEPTGDIASYEPTPTQPMWEYVIPIPGGGGSTPGTETLRPNAPGDQTSIQFQFPGTGEHYDKVNEETADDFSTFVFTTSASYKRDLYHLDTHDEGSGTINAITVFFRFTGLDHQDDPATASARAVIKTHGEVFTGDEETSGGLTFETKAYSWLTNPYTGSAWTWEEIDTLQAGVELKKSGGGYVSACTQVFVTVDYEGEAPPPDICGDVPVGNLFAITPHPDYTGDLTVNVYLMNTGDLIKAYQYLNLGLTLQGAEHNPQLLTLHNGVATFTLPGCSGSTHILSVTSGSYCLVSDDPEDWAPGASIVPELQCDIVQR